MTRIEVRPWGNSELQFGLGKLLLCTVVGEEGEKEYHRYARKIVEKHQKNIRRSIIQHTIKMCDGGNRYGKWEVLV